MSIAVVEIHKTASTDIDEHASALHGWNQRYNQLGAGVFSGNFLQIRLPGVALFRETTNVKLCQDIIAPSRSVTFALPLPGSADGVFDRQTVGVGAALILHGGISQNFLCRDRMDLVAAVLDFDGLGDEGQAIADSLPAQGAGVLQGAGTGVVAGLIAAMIGELSASLPQGSDKTEFSTLPSTIAFRCLDLLRGYSAEMRPNLKSRQRYRLIAEIAELVDSFGENLPGLPVLAQKLGVSIRTLEYCFTEAVGLSPSVYIRNIRLNQARRDLCAAQAQRTTVAEIATKWGFWHFGRFSSFYRELFGESPSATLRGSAVRTAG